MRLFKQLIYGTGFLLIVFGLVFSAWYFNTDRPNCQDGLKNGEEEGVDCGLLACGILCPPPVIDLKINEVMVFEVAEGEFDFAAEIFNPNNDYGAREVYYDLILVDSFGGEVYRSEESFYILPGQVKYVIVPSVKENSEVIKADMEIKEVTWMGYNPLGTIQFPLRSQERTGTPTNSQFMGVVINDSDFDFDNVEVRVLVKNNFGEIIAVQASPIKTLLSKTERHFIVTWPFVIPGFENARVEVEADTNLFKNSNFLKVHGGNDQPFQKFY